MQLKFLRPFAGCSLWDYKNNEGIRAKLLVIMYHLNGTIVDYG
jgi:hypothetical protein